MNTDVAGRVRNVQLPTSKPLLPLSLSPLDMLRCATRSVPVPEFQSRRTVEWVAGALPSETSGARRQAAHPLGFAAQRSRSLLLLTQSHPVYTETFERLSHRFHTT
jgi:hypothetical protein